MSKLDIAKEQIAYLKFWLGVTVVINISGVIAMEVITTIVLVSVTFFFAYLALDAAHHNKS